MKHKQSIFYKHLT